MSLSLGTAWASLDIKLDGLERGLANAERKFGVSTRRIDEASVRVAGNIERNFKQAADSMSRNMALAGGLIATGLAAAGKKAADFEGSLRNVNSIAKLSEKQFGSLRQSVLDLTDDPNIRQGPKNLADGLYDISSSGFTGKKALDVLKFSAYGASAGLTDTATSSKVLTASLNSGIKGAKDAKSTMDVLFKTVDLGVITFGELAGSLGQILPTASKAGISLQEVGAAIAVMTRSGQSGAEATNDLLNVVTKIIRPTDDSLKLFKSLGISHGIGALQAKGLAGVLQEIVEKTKGNSQALNVLMPDMQAFRGLLSLTKNGGQDFNEMLAKQQEAGKGAGSTMAALKEQSKSAAFQFDVAKKSLEKVAIEIGTELLPVGTKLLGWLREGTSWFGRLSPEAKSTATTIAAVGAAGLLATAGVLKITSAVIGLRGAMIAAGITGAGFAAMLARLAGVLNPAMMTVGLMTLAGRADAAVPPVATDTRKRLAQVEMNIRAKRGAKASGLADPYGMRDQDILLAQKEAAALRMQLQAAGLASKLAADAKKLSGGNPQSGGGIDLNAIMGGSKEDRRAARDAARAAKDAARDASERLQEVRQLRRDLMELQGNAEGVSLFDALQEFYTGKEKGAPIGGLTERLRGRAEAARKAASDIREAVLTRGGGMVEGLKENGAAMADSLASGFRAAMKSLTKDEDDIAAIFRASEATLDAAKAEGAVVQGAWLNGWMQSMENSVNGMAQGLIMAGENASSLAAKMRERENQKLIERVQTQEEENDRASGLLQGIQERKYDRAAESIRNSFGGRLGMEAGAEFSNGFARTLEKALGGGSLGKIFARAASGWMDNFLQGALDRTIGGLAGKAGKGGGGGIAGGLLNAVTGGLFGGVSSLIGGLFGGGKKGGGGGMGFSDALSIFGFAKGGWVPGPVDAPQIAVVHGGERVLTRAQQADFGGGVTINLNGVTVGNDYDVDRLVDRLSWATKNRLAVNPGSG